jgi:immune inhibitor A
MHAGYGNESTGGGADTGDIWSQVVRFSSSPTNGFTEGAVVPAREMNAVPFGVICHEFGHILGLPDLYDTSTGKTKYVGNWDIMDRGCWNGTPAGSSPSHFSSWCKIFLHWITPTNVSSSGTIIVDNFETYPSTYKIPVVDNEYYLVEYRKKTKFDSSLPGQGILIWRIDDSVGGGPTHWDFAEYNDINVSDTHPRVKLIEADGNNSIFNYERSESTDAYYLSSQIFRAPYSYSDIPTSITISNFSGAGSDSMTTLIALILSSSTLEIKKAMNYPNPIRGDETTIRMSFSSPISSGTIKIYNIAGELVFSVGIDENNFKVDKSSNYEWVYEYNWKLENNFGNKVAPGVYVYVCEGNLGSTKQVKIGKLAVIR